MAGASADRVLVLDDHRLVLDAVRSSLEAPGLDLVLCDRPEEALEILGREKIDLAISDVQMPEIDGFEFLERARDVDPDLDVMFMTGYATVEGAVRSLHRGAVHYIAKPFDSEELRAIVQETLERRRRERPAPSAKFESAVAPIVGQSLGLIEMLPQIQDFAEHSTTVLIHGETGCGKELVARAIHDAGPRSEGPYIVCNCSAFSETLMESEFFGHAEGAFTDADDTRAGLYEQAHGGVLFLDEIGDMPLPSQAKLLRVLERGEVQRVGETHARRFDVQVIAATNKDLLEEVRRGRFRKDLYFRLTVGRITVPPLRERREDVAALADRFLSEAAAEYRKPKPSLDPLALKALESYDWPGNVRELRNAIHRVMLFRDGGPLSLAHFPEIAAAARLPAARPAEATMDAVRKEHIGRVLDRLGGNKTEAARVLGISRVTLYRELERYGLNAGS